ncbi:hypothetical protein [Mycolicibacterium sp.]|uniref:hypothetical protein n=1 Tax=Mycolicibacterium sp. TaxID=2320850 RepID=UPI0037C51562
MTVPPPPGSWPPPPESGDNEPRFGEPSISPPPPAPSWDQLFELDDIRRPTARPQPQRRKPDPKWVLAGLAAIALIVVIALVVWLVPSDRGAESASGSTSSEASPAVPDPAVKEAQARLSELIPAGYPAGSCKPTPAPSFAVAAMTCEKNSDPGGPVTATYTLTRSRQDLSAAFNEIVKKSVTVECPGRIQSPGPWRRNATPQQVSGTLFCGMQGQPVVAWTDDARLLLSVVRADARQPTLPQLYSWWSSHS